MSQPSPSQGSALARLLVMRLTAVAALVAACATLTLGIGGFLKGIPSLPWATVVAGTLMTAAIVSLRIQSRSLEKLVKPEVQNRPSTPVGHDGGSRREPFNLWALAPTLAAGGYMFAVVLQLAGVLRWPDGVYAGLLIAASVVGILLVLRAWRLRGQAKKDPGSDGQQMRMKDRSP